MKLTPLKAIRRKCRECCGGSYRAIRDCDSENCPLRSYRLGHYPEHGNRVRVAKLADN